MHYIGGMKSIFLILIFSFLGVSVTGISQEISDKQITFSNEFVAAISDHSENKTMKHLDKTYKKEQLVNALFGGEDLSDSNKYLNFKINEFGFEGAKG